MDEETSLEGSRNKFSALSMNLMDACYEVNEEETEVLVTNRPTLFNGKSSSLEFAVGVDSPNTISFSWVKEPAGHDQTPPWAPASSHCTVGRQADLGSFWPKL